jgi:hypothetical protein
VFYLSRLWESRHRYVYRCGPVPFTGNSRYRRGRTYYRQPQTLAVNRQAHWVHIENREAPYPIKGRQRWAPTSWDDIPPGDISTRTWKQSRRTRWKRPAVSFRMLVREVDDLLD